MSRNDAEEHCAKISHVSLERCILWNDDKMVNLCSLMRCFSYDVTVMHFTMPAPFILKSGDNKSPCATWQILKISKSLSTLLKSVNVPTTGNLNENLSWKQEQCMHELLVSWQSNLNLMFWNILVLYLLQDFTKMQ